MTASIKLVVFDLDGTLVDSLGHIARAVRETAQTLGIPSPSDAAIPRVIGLSLDVALARLFAGQGADVLKEADRVYRQIFAEWRAKPGHLEPLFPGVADVLNELEAAGYLLGIATGKARRGVDIVLDGHGLGGRFVTIQTPDTAPGKPHPGMLHQAMSATGAAPEHTVMIGDTVYDIAMARAAGAHALGVSWGNHPADELRQNGAHNVVDRIDQVLHAVDAMTSRHLASTEAQP